MYLFKNIARQPRVAGESRRPAASRLRAATAAVLTLAAGMPAGFAQQADRAASDLPQAPAPVLTEPFALRSSARDFSLPFAPLRGNPVHAYLPTSIGKASFTNSVRMSDLVKDGKIYLSLSDAIALALENNYDIAIARYNLDIADTDILRAQAGGTPLGVSTGIVDNTLTGSTSTSVSAGGPGGTTVGSGGAASGSSGLVLTTAGAGPSPESYDPTLTGAVSFDHAESPQTSIFSPRAFTNTNSYNFEYTQGFAPGTSLDVTFDNSRITTNGLSSYSPEYTSSFKAKVTQHLLQGAGIWVNKRFIYQALNDRRITDSSFRQQLLYTVNKVESIYWGLVSAYEDVQAKQRALEQSTKLLDDDKKQLEIGTMAPLDVVNAESSVASDQQALMSSQNSLNYQQQIIKQAIARNLNDPALESAAVIPTDRIGLEEIPEEKAPVDELVKTAFQQRPALEQAVVQLKNNEITLKGARNALLPTFDVYGYYGASGVGGAPNKSCSFGTESCAATTSTGYGDVFNDLFNSSSPDKGIGFNLSINLRNRQAQSVQARSLLEYRQAELRLAQLYTQIRMQVVNAQLALANDRAQVKAALASRDYNRQSLDAEQKKLHLGASTTASVLLQQRNLATAENSVISANAAYANARASLYQILASTLQHYGINLNEAATGEIKTTPVVPGLTPVKAEAK